MNWALIQTRLNGSWLWSNINKRRVHLSSCINTSSQVQFCVHQGPSLPWDGLGKGERSQRATPLLWDPQRNWDLACETEFREMMTVPIAWPSNAHTHTNICTYTDGKEPAVGSNSQWLETELVWNELGRRLWAPLPDAWWEAGSHWIREQLVGNSIMGCLPREESLSPSIHLRESDAYGQVNGMRRKGGPRLLPRDILPEAFDADPLNMNGFLTLHQSIQFPMSQQFTPLSPVSHSESSLTPV